MVIGCMQATDVRVIDTICSYRNREKVWVDFRYAAYSPGEWLWIDSNSNKLAPYGNDGRILLTANFKVTWHRNWGKIQKSGHDTLQVSSPKYEYILTFSDTWNPVKFGINSSENLLHQKMPQQYLVVWQVSAATDRPMRNAAYRPLCCTQRWTFSFITWQPMTVASLSHWASA